jgi:predicted signal transduction protein with EAL and GGDEF domain
VFWRVGFELSLIAYVVLSSVKLVSPLHRVSVGIVASVAIVLVLTCVLTLLAIQADSVLPALQEQGRYTRATQIMAIVSFSAGLLVLLWFWWRGPKSVLDLWLLVVIFMLLLSAALNSVLNTGRFDFGFVFGRLFGLAAASFVLINLLIQNSRLYAKLAAGQAELQRLTRVDPLTGIANRRAFDAAIESEWRRAMRNKTSLALLLVDVDGFKSFNAVCAVSTCALQHSGRGCVRADRDRFAHAAGNLRRRSSPDSYPLRTRIVLRGPVWLDDRPGCAVDFVTSATLGSRPLGAGRRLRADSRSCIEFDA